MGGSGYDSYAFVNSRGFLETGPVIAVTPACARSRASPRLLFWAMAFGVTTDLWKPMKQQQVVHCIAPFAVWIVFTRGMEAIVLHG